MTLYIIMKCVGIKYCMNININFANGNDMETKKT